MTNELLSRIACLLPGAEPVDGSWVDREEAGVSGAYALVMRLAAPVEFSRSNVPAARLSGWLVYAGSARGPGGIQARLRRHLRLDKPVHWHVDELTNAAADLAAMAVPGGWECEIVETLLQSAQFEPALAGFGSSDCRRCTAHLLRPVVS